MKYYSALNKEEILTHCTTWIQLKDLVLSKICQSQKDKYCVIPPMRYLEWSDLEIQSGGC